MVIVHKWNKRKKVVNVSIQFYGNEADQQNSENQQGGWKGLPLLLVPLKYYFSNYYHR